MKLLKWLIAGFCGFWNETKWKKFQPHQISLKIFVSLLFSLLWAGNDRYLFNVAFRCLERVLIHDKWRILFLQTKQFYVILRIYYPFGYFLLVCLYSICFKFKAVMFD